jgi:hypothetical protein
VQEIYSIPPAIRKNLDTLWVFGGLSSKQAFNVLLNLAFPDAGEKKDIIWENYKKITAKQVLLFTYDKNGTRVEIISK